MSGKRLLAAGLAAVSLLALGGSSAVAESGVWDGNNGRICDGKAINLYGKMYRLENGFNPDSIDFNHFPGPEVEATKNGGVIATMRVQLRKIDASNNDVLVGENFDSNPVDGAWNNFGSFDHEIGVNREPYFRLTAFYQTGDSCSVNLSWKHNWQNG